MAGEAVGFATVLLLKPVPGLQLYVVAPLALRLAEAPAQIVEPPVAVTPGIGFTVITAVAVAEQPEDVPVTVYVVVEVGVAVTVGAVVELRPVAGSQLYVAPPLAISMLLPPVQMEAVEGDTATVGTGFTVIVTVAVLKQVPDVPVTVYVVVVAGVAIGFAIVVLLRPVTGLQLYDVVPDAFSGVEMPLQIVAVPVATSDKPVMLKAASLWSVRVPTLASVTRTSVLEEIVFGIVHA